MLKVNGKLPYGVLILNYLPSYESVLYSTVVSTKLSWSNAMLWTVLQLVVPSKYPIGFCHI